MGQCFVFCYIMDVDYEQKIEVVSDIVDLLYLWIGYEMLFIFFKQIEMFIFNGYLYYNGDWFFYFIGVY